MLEMLGNTFMTVSIVLGMGCVHYGIDNGIIIGSIVVLFAISMIDWIDGLE